MNNKMEFAETMVNWDNNLYSPGMNECEIYGITWGCDEDCPVYKRGECELQEENKRMFEGLSNDEYA